MGRSNHTLRVVVADDNHMQRAGFVALLDAADGLTVVGEAANGAEAIHVTLATHADVVLMDVMMPMLDGMAATRQLLAAHDLAQRIGSRTADSPHVVMLADAGTEEYVYEALRDGARGFMTKDARADELATVVRMAADDRVVPFAADTVALIAAFTPDRSDRAEVAALRGALSTGDAIVVVGVARGHDDDQIARHLGISPDEVHRRVMSLLDSLRLRDRTQLVVFAYESGLVTPSTARTRG